MLSSELHPWLSISLDNYCPLAVEEFFKIDSHNVPLSRYPSDGNLVWKDDLYAMQSPVCTGVAIDSPQTPHVFPIFYIRVKRNTPSSALERNVLSKDP